MKQKSKIKDKPLILYEKYKKDHRIITDMDMDMEKNSSHTNKRKSIFGVIGNVFITGILIGMIFLSSVGAITLIHPEMKEMFVQIISK